MNAFTQFGLTEEEVLAETVEASYPKVVAGRVAHIDADFMTYQAAAETADELSGVKPRKTAEEMCARAQRGLEHQMRLCAAETYIAHITPSGSDKGGRNAQAVTLPYQGNRADRVRPEHLDAVRYYIGSVLPNVVHLDQEADDGMAQANYGAVAEGRGELSVIVSKDKDLRMVPGLHWDFDTEQVICVGDTFGYIWIDTKGSAKKLLGWGTKFFWAQLLMGDTADNIKGLPFATYGALWSINRAPRSLTKVMDKANRVKKREDLERYKVLLDVERQKLKACGAVMASDLLADCNNDKECYARVRMLFQALTDHPVYTFVHHATQQPVTPTVAMFGDMQLLWMRRNKDPRDVLAWLKGEVL